MTAKISSVSLNGSARVDVLRGAAMRGSSPGRGRVVPDSTNRGRVTCACASNSRAASRWRASPRVGRETRSDGIRSSPAAG
jgi:hypothetical protein